MADPIRFKARAERPTEQTAREEWEALLQTLHDSGALRILGGLVGRSGAIAEIAVDRLGSESGRNALSNGAILGEAIAAVRPEALRRISAAVARAILAAAHGAGGRVPGLFGLWAELQRPDTRRALFAALAFLRTIGAELGKDESPAVEGPPASHEERSA
jgi:uncharacterized protein YjgD (DUF1641 family)